ncbi:MAG: toprim domain-containing protein [Pirellulales bacterium]
MTTRCCKANVELMNIKQAKQIPLEDFLERLGYKPSRKSGAQIWYISPLRAEGTPSFKINQQRNLWYDFGLGEGGDIIDLVQQMERTNGTSETLARIAAIVGNAPLPARRQSDSKQVEELNSLKLLHAGPIQSRQLFAYLRNRGIDLKQVSSVVQEVAYRCGEREHVALGFANVMGGFELRSPSFKGTLGAKDISILGQNSQRVLVFEGFFDLLSAIVMQGGMPEATIVVLNSVALRSKAVEAILNLNPEFVKIYRDRDSAGEQLFGYLQAALPDSKVIDCSALYAGYKDLNEWHSQAGRVKSAVTLAQ